jgi:hypothetical protein
MPVVDPIDNPARLSPLTNPFIFSSFLILPNLFSSNTPIPFLWRSLGSIVAPR